MSKLHKKGRSFTQVQVTCRSRVVSYKRIVWAHEFLWVLCFFFSIRNLTNDIVPNVSFFVVKFVVKTFVKG